MKTFRVKLVSAVVSGLCATGAFAAQCDGLTGQAQIDCLATSNKQATPDINSKEDAPGQPRTPQSVHRTAAQKKVPRSSPPPVPPQLSKESAPGQPPAAQPVSKSSVKGAPIGSKGRPSTPSEFGPESAPGQTPQAPAKAP